MFQARGRDSPFDLWSRPTGETVESDQLCFSLRVSKVKTAVLILTGLGGIEDKVRGLGLRDRIFAFSVLARWKSR
jgi:hypothetical protein